MSNEKKRFSLEVETQIANAIRAGIEKTKHHQKYTARVHDAIKAEVVKVFPGMNPVVCCGVKTIEVWVNELCHYDNRFFAIWNWPGRFSSPEDQAKHWSVPILCEMQRCDSSDVMERIEQENTLDVEFSKLELRAREARQMLEDLRAQAVARIAALPIPKAATLRTSSCHWDHPTSATAARYGNLFGKIEIDN